MNLEELRSLYDFSGRTVLVTGGTGVLAVEMVRTLAECNANVVVLSRNQGQGKKVVEEINTNSTGTGQVIYIQGDVLAIETLQTANETIKTEFGHVDILINAAGGNHPSATTKPDLSSK